jgi:hypothetical protein
MKIGDIVKLKTNCIWNGCSGVVHRITKDLVCVTLPDNKTKLAFSHHEVIIGK